MGNTIGGKKSAKVMKITGETIKLKTPIKANEVVKDYPGHVLLESEAVKHYGIRAKPLEPTQELLPKRLYFLVELPKSANDKVPRRAWSGINMSAKERLENLMLARRSTSDLSIIKTSSTTRNDDDGSVGGGAMRVKMRVSKSEMERLVSESSNGSEVAAKIVDLCLANNKTTNVFGVNGVQGQPRLHWKSSNGHQVQYGNVGDDVIKSRDRKRVSFLPINEGEMQTAVAVPSY